MSELLAQAQIDSRLRAPLEGFVKDINGLSVPAPRSICLIGPAARGEFSDANPEINLLLIYDAISADTVEALAALGAKHGKRGFRAPLLLSASYVTGGGDVFPIELLDLCKNNILLAGEDLLKQVEINPSHLRLQVERELRSLRMGLRQSYLRAANDGDWMAGWFTDAVVNVFPVFRAMLKLLGGDATAGNTDATQRLASASGVDLSAFIEIWDLRKQKKTLDKSRVREMFDRWEGAAAALVEQVDGLSV